MNNNPWVTDRKPTEYDADPCGNVEVAFTNRNSPTLLEKLGVQIYNERHYWKKVSAGMITGPWRHTPEWISKTSIEGIKRDLDKKFDKIEKDYLEKSKLSKALSFQKHSDFGKRQDQAFEHARKYGSFPLDVKYTLEIKDGVLSGSILTSSGWSSPQWVYSGPNFKKPNWLGRQLAKLCGMEWVNE